MSDIGTDAKDTRTIWSEFEEWAKPFAPWQRYSLCNIIRTGPLSNECVDAAYAQLLHDNKLGPAPAPPLEIPESIVGRPATDPQGTVHLKGLSNLRGVNALPSDAALTFSPGLTIVYGGNGVGKSGFARILSSTCFCRNHTPIIPNIYAEGPQPALAATLTLGHPDHADADAAVELKGSVLIPELKRFSVFDTKEARTYLTEQNPLGFKPIGFDVFPEMAATYSKLLAKLDTEIANSTTANTFSDSFITPTSEVSKFVAGLNANTSLGDLNRWATFGEQEEARLAETSRQIAELQTQSVESAVAQLEPAKVDLAGIQMNLAAALRHTSPEIRALDRSLIDQSNELAASVTAMGSESFKRTFFKATGTQQWEDFLASAHALADQESADYPHDGDHCLFCHQPLDSASQELIKRYWVFLTSDLRAQSDAAKTAREAAIENLVLAKWNFFDAGTTAHATLTRLRPELTTRLEAVVRSAASFCEQTVEKLRTGGPDPAKPEWEDLSGPLGELAQQVDEDLTLLKGNTTAEAIKTLERERVLLRHRQVLHQLRDQIALWISKQKWAASAAGVRKALNPRPITDKEKELFESVIAEGYRTRLRDECLALSCVVPVEMHTQGQKGETVRSLKMKGHKPDQILSEGEQRAVALADFLTEVGLNPSATGIILDDPVNSQDHARKSLIAKRLFDEARCRQVIIFTHDMVFLARLNEQEGDVPVVTHWVERNSDGRPGQVTLNDSPAETKQYWKTEKAAATLAEAKAATGSDRQRLVQRGMGELRRTLEEIVPHFLFKDVVGRWRDRIILTALKRVNWDDALVGEIVASFEEFGLSGYMEGHSHPDESADRLLTRFSLRAVSIV